MVAPPRPRGAPASAPSPRQEYREKFGRPSRYVPTDKFFAAFEELRQRDASAQEIRMLALQEVQRARVAPADKIKLFIPAPKIAGTYAIEDILHAINRETQSPTWDGALNSLCDFVCVRGYGIRFTCTNRDIAIKLGGTAVSCMGEKLIVKPYSVYERLYFVDLTRVPSELDDEVIYDFFLQLGLQPIIAPTHQAGTLMSRDRTVWFPQVDVPDALFKDGQPLREIHFAGFDNPVYVQHKKRVLNRVVPPSIAAKRQASEQQAREAKAAAAAKRASRPGAARPSAPEDSESTAADAGTADQEGLLILERPAATKPVQDWIRISRRAQCSTLSTKVPTKELDYEIKPVDDGHLIFGIPVQPSGFELAFSDHDDETTAGDADCFVSVGDDIVAAAPRPTAETMGDLMAARSLLGPKSGSMKRSKYRTKARKVAKKLLDGGEPEDRLAALTAQPCAYAPLIHACSPDMGHVETEHALLRLYSGRPASKYGPERSFMKRLCMDYPPGHTSGSHDILVDQLRDDSDRALAIAYARMDLFLRTHAPAIYHDPVKVAALCGDTPPTCLQYSNFLLWSDQTLALLCASKLGSEYSEYLSAPVRGAMRRVLDDIDDNASMDSSDQASATEGPPEDDYMSSGSNETTHL